VNEHGGCWKPSNISVKLYPQRDEQSYIVYPFNRGKNDKKKGKATAGDTNASYEENAFHLRWGREDEGTGLVWSRNGTKSGKKGIYAQLYPSILMR
jgi:hypothetical protein